MPPAVDKLYSQHMICSYLIRKTKLDVSYQKISSEYKEKNDGIASPQTSEFHKKVIVSDVWSVHLPSLSMVDEFLLTFILCDSSWSILNFGLDTLFLNLTALH